MKKLVIDSSVLVKWLNQQNEERTDAADRILDDVRIGQVSLYAPELAKYEIGNALLLRKKLDDSQAETAFEALFVLPIQFIAETREMAGYAYRIARELGITYYDASFLALAAQEDAELITDNPKLQAKTSQIRVKALADY